MTVEFGPILRAELFVGSSREFRCTSRLDLASSCMNVVPAPTPSSLCLSRQGSDYGLHYQCVPEEDHRIMPTQKILTLNGQDRQCFKRSYSVN